MDALQPIAAVVLVLALLAGSLYLLKKRAAPRGNPGRMEVIERLTLGPHHALHLVRIGDRTLVVATSPTACRLLSTKET